MIEIHVTVLEGTLEQYYKEKFKVAFAELLKAVVSKDVEIVFYDDAPDSKPLKAKANTLAVTAVFEYENTTALSANLLLESHSFDENTNYPR